MKQITTILELQEAIELLKTNQQIELKMLKEQLKETLTTLRPANLIRNVVKDLSEAPDFKGDLINASLSIGAGYLTKKAAIGNTSNPLKNLLGTIIQTAVTKIVSKNTSEIRSGTSLLIARLFNNTKE